MISTVSSDRSIRRPPARAAALWLAVALTVCGSGAATVPAEEPTSKSVTAELKATFDRARDKVFPALVSIITVREYYSQGRKRLSRSGGSGTIISDQGYIVTNAHVAQDGSRFKVILSDKREIDAKLIGEDPASDLAVIQLDSTQLEVGDSYYTISRMGERFDRVPLVSSSSIAAVVQNPRPLLVGSGMTPWGGPVFSADGKAAGFVVTQPPEPGEQGAMSLESMMNMGGFILPAKKIVKAMEQAREIAKKQPAEDDEDSEPGESP